MNTGIAIESILKLGGSKKESRFENEAAFFL